MCELKSDGGEFGTEELGALISGMVKGLAQSAGGSEGATGPEWQSLKTLEHGLGRVAQREKGRETGVSVSGDVSRVAPSAVPAGFRRQNSWPPRHAIRSLKRRQRLLLPCCHAGGPCVDAAGHSRACPSSCLLFHHLFSSTSCYFQGCACGPGSRLSPWSAILIIGHYSKSPAMASLSDSSLTQSRRFPITIPNPAILSSLGSARVVSLPDCTNSSSASICKQSGCSRHPLTVCWLARDAFSSFDMSLSCHGPCAEYASLMLDHPSSAETGLLSACCPDDVGARVALRPAFVCS
ncbi:uncharacterized protein J3D65DRAFT_121759 [Phyllosticta citribraziliensis]|uniref:Uncharacterized protein n=1 Tax=Phyllosticta citribraziliensis TaxID=989973 RepID=A0ABR1LAK3_9PEZI